ncbi:MAG: hypothetical protein ABL876_06010 [Chitinophagaceae bacterium]
MAKIPLQKDSEFIVGEEKVLVYVLASLFFGLFLYGLIESIVTHFAKLTYLNFIFAVALLPAILLYRKGKSNRIYIRVNKKGIYQDERLVTGWFNLLKVYITQKETVISIQDNFLLVVEYRKEGSKDGFRRRIPLTNTQNKSEEDVLAAIQFFWKLYKKDTGM